MDGRVCVSASAGPGEIQSDLFYDYRTNVNVPNAEVHVLDAGRFALNTAADEIAALVRVFWLRQLRERRLNLRCSM